MADRPILQVSGSLDEQKSKVQLQSQLDKIGKSLKLTIGFEQGANGDVEKKTKAMKEYNVQLAEIIHKMNDNLSISLFWLQYIYWLRYSIVSQTSKA